MSTCNFSYRLPHLACKGVWPWDTRVWLGDVGSCSPELSHALGQRRSTSYASTFRVVVGCGTRMMMPVQFRQREPHPAVRCIAMKEGLPTSSTLTYDHSRDQDARLFILHLSFCFSFVPFQSPHPVPDNSFATF